MIHLLRLLARKFPALRNSIVVLTVVLIPLFLIAGSITELLSYVHELPIFNSVEAAGVGDSNFEIKLLEAKGVEEHVVDRDLLDVDDSDNPQPSTSTAADAMEAKKKTPSPVGDEIISLSSEEMVIKEPTATETGNLDLQRYVTPTVTPTEEEKCGCFS